MMAVDRFQPQKHQAANPGLSLEPYLKTPLRLFVWDEVLLKQMLLALNGLGFKSISTSWVKPNYFQAMRQLYSQLVEFEGLVLVNHPPQIASGQNAERGPDLGLSDFFGGVASLVGDSDNKIQKLLGKCIPVFEAPPDEEVRENIIKELLPLGITGAFMLQNQPGVPASDMMFSLRSKELYYYMLEHFLHGERRLTDYRRNQEASELKIRRARAELLMSEVDRLKAAKNYDKAIALCRKAIDLLPDEPDAYLEGGRMLVKKRKYTAAMRMFRDAEAVAEDLPAPNQEIGLLRVAQVKDYLDQCRQSGQPASKAKVEEYLNEAVASFKESMDKAERITALNPEEQDQKRKEALASIASSMLSLGLNESLPESHPLAMELVGMAEECLTQRIPGGAQLSALQLIPLALKAFYDGDFDKAEDDLFKASEEPEAFQKACVKLNYIATQLRRMGHFEKALSIYQRLLALSPPFKGVILFNQAIAHQSQASHATTPFTFEERQKIESISLAMAVEALFDEPTLPYDDNFYKNTVLANVLERGVDIFNRLCNRGVFLEEPTAPACRQARDQVDDLICRGQHSQAIHHMLELAMKMPEFFKNFHHHPSAQILSFAAKIQPLLVQRPEPKLRSLGKLFSILLNRGRLGNQVSLSSLDPALEPVVMALKRDNISQAAGQLTGVLWNKPELLNDNRLARSQGIMNLCRQIDQKLGTIDLPRFGADLGFSGSESLEIDEI
jgi:tetratricopeptide (TPR) repeat protein